MRPPPGEFLYCYCRICFRRCGDGRAVCGRAYRRAADGSVPAAPPGPDAIHDGRTRLVFYSSHFILPLQSVIANPGFFFWDFFYSIRFFCPQPFTLFCFLVYPGLDEGFLRDQTDDA